jgi:hypothetical protein
MAREKRNRADEVIARTQARIFGVACDQPSGYGVEMKISPPEGSERSKVNLKRNKKFDRHFDGIYTAADRTMAQVKSLYPNIIDIRNVPFWKAFLPIKKTNFNYDKYFATQQSELNYRLSLLSHYSTTQDHQKLIEEIVKIASLDTTASFVCLALKMQQAKQQNNFILYKALDNFTSHLFLLGLYHHTYLALDLDNLISLIHENWISDKVETSWPKTSDELLKSFFTYPQLLHKAGYLSLINKSQQLAFGLLCIRIDTQELNQFLNTLLKEGFQGSFNMQELTLMVSPFIKH